MTDTRKPTLKVKKVAYFGVDYNELDKFIKAVYGVYYSCVGSQEWGNDSQHRVHAEAVELGPWDAKKLEEVKAGKEPSYSLGAVMNDLAFQGLIEPGEYLIDVCW